SSICVSTAFDIDCLTRGVHASRLSCSICPRNANRSSKMAFSNRARSRRGPPRGFLRKRANYLLDFGDFLPQQAGLDLRASPRGSGRSWLSRRRVGPPRAGEFGLRPPVEGTGARKAWAAAASDESFSAR